MQEMKHEQQNQFVRFAWLLLKAPVSIILISHRANQFLINKGLTNIQDVNGLANGNYVKLIRLKLWFGLNYFGLNSCWRQDKRIGESGLDQVSYLHLWFGKTVRQPYCCHTERERSGRVEHRGHCLVLLLGRTSYQSCLHNEKKKPLTLLRANYSLVVKQTFSR